MLATCERQHVAGVHAMHFSSEADGYRAAANHSGPF
jgi:hypothetical protein